MARAQTREGSSMDRRIAPLLAAILLLSVAAAVGGGPVVAAQEDNSTNQTAEAAQPAGPTAGGPYDIEELRDSGRSEGIDEVKSVRSIGDPPEGFVAARYRDPTLIDAMSGSPGEWKDIQAGETVQQNEIQVYGSAFGELSGEYDIVIVFWQPEKTENGTTYAANQTVKRQSITLSQQELYSFENVTLPEHLDNTWQTTMWLERGDKKMDGVQWTYKHRSNPESSAVSINSQAEAWGFVLRSAVIPGIGSLVIGLVAARGVLRKTGRGPGYGVGSWLFLLFIVGMFVSMIAYYEISVILSNLPYVMGLSIGVVAFGAGLTFHQPVKKIAFMRRELGDATIIPGGGRVAVEADGGEVPPDSINLGDMGAELFSEFSEALYLDMPEVPAVRTDDGYRIPVTGLKAFFARIWADAALLDMSNIATRQRVREGRIDDLITVDPKVEPALEHKPARLVRVLPWDTVSDDADWKEEAVAGMMTAAILLAPASIGFMALDNMLNLGSVGIVGGLVATAIMAYSAEDGWVEFVAAPIQYQRAEDSMTLLQRAYKASAEEKSAKEEKWEEKAKTASEAREERSSEQSTVTDKVLEGLGAGEATDGGEE